MNFQSLVGNSPIHKNGYLSANKPQYSGNSYGNSYPSPPPSGGSDEEFQEQIKFNYSLSNPSSNVQASGSSKPFKTGRNIHWFSNLAQNVTNETTSKYSTPKAFPNLIKNLNDKAENDHKKLKQSPKKGQIINCYTCQNQVRSTELEQHLFFGPAKCIDCERHVSGCLDYSSCKISHYGQDRNCPHNVWEFIEKPFIYLKEPLSTEDIPFKKALPKYLHSLHPLKSVRPYKKAIEACSEYLRFSQVKERQNSQNQNASEPIKHSSNKPKVTPNKHKLPEVTTNKHKLPEVTSNKHKHSEVTSNKHKLPEVTSNKHKLSEVYKNTSNKHKLPDKPKSSKLDHRGKKQKSDDSHNITLPADGHYLIEREPIEECPNCYTQLDPKNLIFNLDSWLISTKCVECFLSIYFVFDPPDGSAPRLQIKFG